MPLNQDQVGTRREAPKDLQLGEKVCGVAVDLRTVKNRNGRTQLLELLLDPSTGELRDVWHRANLTQLFAVVQPGDFLEIERLAAPGEPVNGAAWKGRSSRSWGSDDEDAGEGRRDDRREKALFRFTLWQVRSEAPPAWATPALINSARATAGLPPGTAAPENPSKGRKS